ncbi:MAG: crotonobetainyl-CoA hydratase, partial [Rhodospirillaceae bacterium]|nr:crotonobetainyl-CoA hydratase [Rhodospirillaceae bacterium]
LLVGIVTATGDKVFCAGWDLKEYTADETARQQPFNPGPGGIGGFTENWGLSKPILAAVNGHVVGGGFEMILAADLIIAVDEAEFFLPELKRGFLPDIGGIQRIARKLPYNVAMDLILTGRRMSAAEAKHWGLVSEIVPRERLMDRAHEIAGEIARSAPLAVMALKEVLDTVATLSPREAFARTWAGWKGASGLPVYEAMLRSQDYFEGSKAFVEKRTPVWTGKV